MNKEEKNMERYTLREGGRVLCPTERLEELRGQRKEKTVQFRELLAQKLVNSSLIQLLERKGLK